MKRLLALCLFSMLTLLALGNPAHAATKRFGLVAVSVGAHSATKTVAVLKASQKLELKSVELVDTSLVSASAVDYVTAQAEKDGVLFGSEVNTIAGLAAYTPLALDLGTAPVILEKGEVLSVLLGNSSGSGALTQGSILINYRLIGNE